MMLYHHNQSVQLNVKYSVVNIFSLQLLGLITAMASCLDQLKAHTVVVADTGDFDG